MRAWLPLLLAVGCTGPTVDDGFPDTAAGSGLLTSLISDAPGEEGFLERLDVRLAEVVLEADGPEGPVSLSVSTNRAASLLGEEAEDASTWMYLTPGRYRDVRVTVWLRESNGHAALEAHGELGDEEGDDEGEDGELELDLAVLPSLALPARRESLDIAADIGTELVLRLRPEQWFDGLDLEELAASTDAIFLSPSSGPAYDEIVERIVDSLETEVRDDRDDRDDQDGA
jgi:hypothetical protein